MGEFDLIKRYFQRTASPVTHGKSLVQVGIGDDCAVLTPTLGAQLCLSSDMLVEGRHFFADVDAQSLGHKALAVNLSDLAAAGATPRAFTLALALPKVDEAWLAGFSRGLFALADAHGCELVGGDTVQGPLTICITVFGEVPKGEALLRSGAQVGDDIYVSGAVGQARLALEILRGHVQADAKADAATLVALRDRLERPTPRVNLGIALRGVASACIDVSDGLLGDLNHILQASRVGAQVQTDWIDGSLAFALGGGDDYELLFTASANKRGAVQAAAHKTNVPVTRIGLVTQQQELCLFDAAGARMDNCFSSFDHFASR